MKEQDLIDYEAIHGEAPEEIAEIRRERDDFLLYAKNHLKENVERDAELTALREENARLRELCGEAAIYVAQLRRMGYLDSQHRLVEKLEAASKGE